MFWRSRRSNPWIPGGRASDRVTGPSFHFKLHLCYWISIKSIKNGVDGEIIFVNICDHCKILKMSLLQIKWILFFNINIYQIQKLAECLYIFCVINANYFSMLNYVPFAFYLFIATYVSRQIKAWFRRYVFLMWKKEHVEMCICGFCSNDMVKAHMVSEFSVVCLVVFA